MRVYQKISDQLNNLESAKKRNYVSAIEEIYYNLHKNFKKYLQFDCNDQERNKDGNVSLDYSSSNPERLVFVTSYHHKDDYGNYDGWTYHKIIVTPSLLNTFNIEVIGTNKNEICEHIADCFTDMLYAEYSDIADCFTDMLYAEYSDK